MTAMLHQVLQLVARDCRRNEIQIGQIARDRRRRDQQVASPLGFKSAGRRTSGAREGFSNQHADERVREIIQAPLSDEIRKHKNAEHRKGNCDFSQRAEDETDPRRDADATRAIELTVDGQLREHSSYKRT